MHRKMVFIAALLTVIIMAGCGPKSFYKFDVMWGTKGTDEGQFQYAEDFAIDGNGNILVTDAINANVQVFSADGKFITRFGIKGKGKDNNELEKPEGIAIDPVTGDIFVADYVTGYIKKFDKNYNWISTFSEYGTEDGQNMESEFMSIASNNLLYMAEAGNNRVDVFDLDGNFKFWFGGKGQDPGQMSRPEAAKADSLNRIVVADLGNNRVNIYNLEGKLIKSFGKEGEAEGEFRKPAGIAIDKDNNIYVTEIGNNRVQKFDSEGNFICMWGKAGTGQSEFGNLHGIIADKAGNVYVADTANNRIQKFIQQK